MQREFVAGISSFVLNKEYRGLSAKYTDNTLCSLAGSKSQENLLLSMKNSCPAPPTGNYYEANF